MRKDDKHELYCGCGRCKPTSRSLVILTPEEAEKAAALNPNDLFWRTEAETLLAKVKADIEGKVEPEG